MGGACGKESAQNADSDKPAKKTTVRKPKPAGPIKEGGLAQ